MKNRAHRQLGLALTPHSCKTVPGISLCHLCCAGFLYFTAWSPSRKEVEFTQGFFEYGNFSWPVVQCRLFFPLIILACLISTFSIDFDIFNFI